MTRANNYVNDVTADDLFKVSLSQLQITSVVKYSEIYIYITLFLLFYQN